MPAGYADDQRRAPSRPHELQQITLHSLPFCAVATGVDGIIFATNPAAESLLGYGRDELVGRPVLLLHDPDELRRRAAELSHQVGVSLEDGFQLVVAAASRGRPEECEWTYLRRDGSSLPVNLAIGAVHDEAGRVSGYLMLAYDISERKRAEAYIRRVAHYDALTGLPNRTLLLDRLDVAIRQARRKDESIAVLMLDLDHFKRVNDSLGHQNGDLLLLNVARRMQQCVREIDTVARFGGDEFVVVLTSVRSREELTPLVSELVKAITAPITIGQQELVVTPSIGGCLFPDDGDDASHLLRHADTAMYQAKASGRGSFHWFAPAMLQQTEEKLALGNALRRAVDAEEFTVSYQPEISLKDGRVLGMEALVRWRHALRGVVAPDRFIPVAEETGLILKLGEWVLRTACSQCVQLQLEMGSPLILAVNVSPRQFQQKDLLDLVRNALRDSHLDPRHLELEITEGVLMQNLVESAAVLSAIRKLGVTVVIDDFGTGYSSLAYLARLPIDKIKIDRSFVQDLGSAAAEAPIINAIIAMAHNLGIRVVAEGVENHAQQSYLRQRDCDEAQGYYYSKAVPAADFAACVNGLGGS